MQKKQDIITKKLAPKKKTNLKTVEFMRNKISESTYYRILECSTFNKFVSTEDKQHKKLVASNSCKNRFCPICTYRKAKRDALLIATIMQAIQKEKKQEFLFLTLTTPNVSEEELELEIDRFNQSFKKLLKRKRVKNAIHGYIRKLEITYNEERNDYNPHFHCILSVNKTYFTDSKYYIKQSDWLELWKSCTGLDNITQLHIIKLKDGNTKNSKGNAVLELAKYSAKDIDMLHSKEVFNVFYSAMKGKQLITFNGLFKEYRRLFKNGELNKYIDEDSNKYIYKIIAKWNMHYKKYEQELELLTELEFEQYNTKKVVELEIEN